MSRIHTPWYTDTNPQKDGVYQRRRTQYQHVKNKPAKLFIRYALFAEGVWHCEAKTAELAAKMKGYPSAFQGTDGDENVIEWRGCLEKHE